MVIRSRGVDERLAVYNGSKLKDESASANGLNVSRCNMQEVEASLKPKMLAIEARNPFSKSCQSCGALQCMLIGTKSTARMSAR